jgi:hypothetical protein
MPLSVEGQVERVEPVAMGEDIFKLDLNFE